MGRLRLDANRPGPKEIVNRKEDVPATIPPAAHGCGEPTSRLEIPGLSVMDDLDNDG